VLDGLLAAAEGTALAGWARVSRWGYAGLSAAHVLGIALLVGAMVPLNLRRLGAFRSVPEAQLARVLTPAAATGLALAAATGAVLFLPRASEYAALPVVRIKLALVAVGTVHAAALHWRYGWLTERAPRGRLAAHAAAALCLWLAVLVLGRLIAFVG
jgi:hypothetical protein